MDRNDPGVAWLLRSRDASIRYLALTDLLHESEQSTEVRVARDQIRRSPRVQALLANQRADGGFGVHQYRKWSGAHWRLVSLVELGVPSGNEAARKAAGNVLTWLAGRRHEPVNGLYRVHASVYGNAIGTCSTFGLGDDSRVQEIAASLVEWQWPDGGWNCDSGKEAHHSSFYESLSTTWGLNEFYLATGDKDAGKAVERACELFLRHRLFRSCVGEEVINPQWLKLHYPLYWHYDVLQALRVIMRAGRLGDARTKEALDIVESKRMRDGSWRPEGCFWRLAKTGMKGLPGPSTEVVDWGRSGPNEMITLNALRVLSGSGRIR